MPFMYSPAAGKMTDHEDVGMDGQGRKMVRCLETGHVHEAASQRSRAVRDEKRAERYKDRTFNEAVNAVRRETEQK